MHVSAVGGQTRRHRVRAPSFLRCNDENIIFGMLQSDSCSSGACSPFFLDT